MKSGRAFISAISHFVRIDLSALSEIRVPKSKVPMAGLEPARALYGPTDFKSVVFPRGNSFNERQRAEYLECAESLKPFNATIRDAVNFYLPHLHATKRTCTAVELVDKLLKDKQADGASERYLSDLRSRLTQFAECFNGKRVAEITAPEVDQWLRSLSDKETGKR